MEKIYEAIVIGSGFGGGISAARLSKKWPGQVLVLERGKRYPMGSFPRKPHDFARNFWNLPDERHRRPSSLGQIESHGMFDIRNYSHMDVVMCAGYGGGSLIYANIFLEPPDWVFDDERWPVKKSELQPYYGVAKEVLGARPVPAWKHGDVNDRRRIVRTEYFQETAQKMGRESKLMDVIVFFGNDFQKPLEIGVQDKNRYGAVQTSCTYCGECDVGCNTHSKNTVDLNYLHVAEHRYQADVRTEHLATKIVPLNESGQADVNADGTHGFQVTVRDLNAKTETIMRTRRVIVSAGTLGTNEILLQNRDFHKTLPRISQRLGHHYSGNGDFLSFVMKTPKHTPADPNYGPVITQATDFNLFKNVDKERAFIMEDASYPVFGAWFLNGALSVGYVQSLWKAAKDIFRRALGHHSMGRIGYVMEDILSYDQNYHSSVHLCMGIDKADGVLTLDPEHKVDVGWPYKNSMKLYRAILDSVKQFKQVVKAKSWMPLFNWVWPFRKNVTVHSLGGCVIAHDPARGVTSARREDFGQVFGYKNLYCADGSIVPTAVGANPIATISALSEMVAEGITGIKPNADL